MPDRAAPYPANDGGGSGSPGGALIEKLLRGEGDESSGPQGTGMFQSVTESWAGRRGVLQHRRPAVLAPSCFVVPRCGDTVLAWAPDAGRVCVMGVLERADPHLPCEVALESVLDIEVKHVRLWAEQIAVSAAQLLSHARTHHVVEGTRSETLGTRVTDVSHDVRRAGHASEEVSGTLLQRTGTWFHNVLREARIHARATLFD